MRLARLDRGHARSLLRALAAVGSGIGVACLLAPGLVTRFAGMQEKPLGLLGLRLFGIRELCLGLGLYRAAEADDRALVRLMTELVALAQGGDLALGAVLAWRGSMTRRAAAAIILGAAPTVAAALAVRRAYSDSRHQVP